MMKNWFHQLCVAVFREVLPKLLTFRLSQDVSSTKANAEGVGGVGTAGGGGGGGGGRRKCTWLVDDAQRPKR